LGRPPEVTDDEIITAGRELEAGGRRISPYTLYQGVGGRGRPKRLWDVWTAHVADPGTAEMPEAPGLPPAIRDGLAAAVRSLGEELERTVRRIAADLAAEAAAQTAAERNALARERAALAESEADALAEFTDITEELERLRTENTEMAETVRRLEIARETGESSVSMLVRRLNDCDRERTAALIESGRVSQRAVAAEQRLALIEAELADLRGMGTSQTSQGHAVGLRHAELSSRPGDAGIPTAAGTRRGRSAGAQRGRAKSGQRGASPNVGESVVEGFASCGD
jgi:hypothetical protein